MLAAAAVGRPSTSAIAGGRSAYEVHLPVVIDGHHPDDHLYVAAVRVFRAAVTRQALPRGQQGLTSSTLTGGP